MPPTFFRQRPRHPLKIAIFTEGQTETIFVTKLLYALAGREKIDIQAKWAMGGRAKLARTFYEMKPVADPAPEAKFYALIFQSGSDSRVTSDVKEQYQSLISQDYSAIVAIRDVAPDFTRNQTDKLRAGFHKNVAHVPVDPFLVLAIMETEAWFIGEHTHFPRIHASLSPEQIFNQTGIDIIHVDIEGLAKPSDNLTSIYRLAGLDYTKSRAEVQRTVDSLDFNEVCTGLSQRTPSVGPLIETLSAFLHQ